MPCTHTNYYESIAISRYFSLNSPEDSPKGEGMIRNSLKILFVGERSRSLIDFKAFGVKFVESKDLVDSVALSYVSCHPKNIQDFTKIVSDYQPDFYILILSKNNQDLITTYCHLALYFNKQAQIVVYQSDKRNYESLSRSLWSLGIREFLSDSMPKYEKFARYNKALSEYVFLKKYQSLSKRLHEISLVDSLTGLSNMRSFYLNYKSMLDTISSPVAVYMIDLDNFKRVNDDNSHLFGSYVLSSVGKLMSHSSIIPKSSLLARYGGDEFVWAIQLDTFDNAVDIARRWLDFLQNNVFHHEGYTTSVTASMGFSFIEAEYQGDYDEPMKVADFMLYRSKRFGKNQVQGVRLADVTDDIEEIDDRYIYAEDKKSRLKKPA